MSVESVYHRSLCVLHQAIGSSGPEDKRLSLSNLAFRYGLTSTGMVVCFLPHFGLVDSHLGEKSGQFSLSLSHSYSTLFLCCTMVSAAAVRQAIVASRNIEPEHAALMWPSDTEVNEEQSDDNDDDVDVYEDLGEDEDDTLTQGQHSRRTVGALWSDDDDDDGVIVEELLPHTHRNNGRGGGSGGHLRVGSSVSAQQLPPAPQSHLIDTSVQESGDAAESDIPVLCCASVTLNVVCDQTD